MSPDVRDKGAVVIPETRRGGWRDSQMLPCALGVCAAALLGASGFALGALYGEATATEAVALGAPPVRRPAAPITRVPVTDAIGGPEEIAAVPVPEIPASRVAVARMQPAGGSLAIGRPVVGGWISSRFGQRTDPFTGRPAVHRGLDFAGLDNSAILAGAPGVVIWSGRRSGYGNLIEIDHGRGWVTRYGHNAYNLVQMGDYVKPGQTIALMGATGRATGTHLHFEVLYRGRPQNPGRLLARDT